MMLDPFGRAFIRKWRSIYNSFDQVQIPGGGGGGLLGSIFAGYVPLPCQNPYLLYSQFHGQLQTPS